jgi:hemerythrin-like metal-binding protein
VVTSTWEAELLRKANQLDTEHATQVRLIDQLLAALEAEDRPRAAVLFGEVLENSSLHFAQEEALMRQHTDPRASAHAGEHRRMLEVLRTLGQRHLAGEAVRGEVTALRIEVTTHIQTMDRDFAAYLSADRLKT